MKQIPFYASDGDDLVAVYQMLFEYYLSKRPTRAQVMEFVSDRPEEALRRQGFDVQPAAATTKAIDTLLLNDYLVCITSAGRAQLILQRAGQDYIVHDPSAGAYRQVRLEQLLTDMPGAQAIGFIYRKAHIARRLDQYVVGQRPKLSRAYAAKLIEQGKVLVNGQTAKVGYKVRPDDIVTIDYDESALQAIPDLDLPVLYEDQDCIVINKPSGVLTHAQGKFIAEATVATFLRSRLKSGDLGGERAGIVHRLDRATSGVIICAKTPAALSWLQSQFAERSAHKTYLAVVRGHLKQKQAVIDMPIERNPKAPATFRVGPNGKSAVTAYDVLEESPTLSLVELRPQTGRTHQLRVHLQKLGHAIVGDPLYGNGTYGDRLYLHAYKLEIILPNGTRKTFTAPVPDAFQAIMKS